MYDLKDYKIYKNIYLCLNFMFNGILMHKLKLTESRMVRVILYYCYYFYIM